MRVSPTSALRHELPYPQQSFWASRLNLLIGWQTPVHRTHPVTCRQRSRTLSFNLNLWSPSQVDAVSGCSRSDRRFASRSGSTSAMAMAPPSSIMTPHMKKPVLNPSSGVAALSITLPMI